jgi:hypothetical protein
MMKTMLEDKPGPRTKEITPAECVEGDVKGRSENL